MDDYVCLWLMIQLQKGAHTILSLSKSICGHRKYLNVNCLAYILLTVEALISPGRLKFSLTVIILVEYSTIKLRCRGWHSSDCTSEKNETRKQPPTTTRSQARDPPYLTLGDAEEANGLLPDGQQLPDHRRPRRRRRHRPNAAAVPGASTLGRRRRPQPEHILLAAAVVSERWSDGKERDEAEAGDAGPPPRRPPPGGQRRRGGRRGRGTGRRGCCRRRWTTRRCRHPYWGCRRPGPGRCRRQRIHCSRARQRRRRMPVRQAAKGEEAAMQ